MNIRELIDTVEAKCRLLTSQQDHEVGVIALRQIQGHLDDVREALGLPNDEPSCCGCSLEPFRRCTDCGGRFCEGCGDVQAGVFVCDVCREEREEAAEAEHARAATNDEVAA